MNENYHHYSNQNHSQNQFENRPVEDQRLIEARDRFIRECQMDDNAIMLARQRGVGDGLICLHVHTRGDNNIVSAEPGKRTLLKHLFLQQPYVRKQIVNYYKQKGFSWVDIVPLNRVDWKIFLFYPENRMHLPIQPITVATEENQTLPKA